MPIQNGKYINPGWVNGAPPAIDMAELNAISDTLENLDAGGGTGGLSGGDGVSVDNGEISIDLSTQPGNRTTFDGQGALYTPPYTQGDGISISGNQVSALLSTQADNAATFGIDGGIYVAESGGGTGGGKKVAVVVGTSASGWTANDCDYLCDGTDDQVEINLAIAAAEVGQVLLLPGTYNIGSQIVIGNDTSLCGAGPFVAAYDAAPLRGSVVIRDTRPWTGTRGNPASASIRCTADNVSFFNITLDSISTSRCGIYAAENLSVLYCNILTRDHCIYSVGRHLTANFSMVGQTSRADLAGACGIYMVPSSIFGLRATLDITGSTIANVVGLYFDVPTEDYSMGTFQFSNSRFIGKAPDSNSGNVTIKNAKSSMITGCFVTGSNTVGRETSLYLDSTTENILATSNTFSGPISDNGTGNYTQNNLIIDI